MRITPAAVGNATVQSMRMLALDFCPDCRHGRGHRDECPWATLGAMRANILRLPSPKHHWTKSAVYRSLPRALHAFGRWYQSMLYGINAAPSSMFRAVADGRGSKRSAGRETRLFTRFPSRSSSTPLPNRGVPAKPKERRLNHTPWIEAPCPPCASRLIRVGFHRCLVHGHVPTSVARLFDYCTRAVGARWTGDPRFHSSPRGPCQLADRNRTSEGTAAPGTRRKRASR